MTQDCLYTGLLAFISDFLKNHWKQELLLAYQGVLNKKLTGIFSEIVREQVKKDLYTKERLNTLEEMMECSINSLSEYVSIVMNSQEDQHLAIFVSHNQSLLQLTSACKIKNEEITFLSQFLETVKSDSTDELDNYPGVHPEKADQPGLLDTMNAFFEIKRKTGGNLEFHFLPCDYSSAFFLLITQLSKN